MNLPIDQTQAKVRGRHRWRGDAARSHSGIWRGVEARHPQWDTLQGAMPGPPQPVPAQGSKRSPPLPASSPSTFEHSKSQLLAKPSSEVGKQVTSRTGSLSLGRAWWGGLLHG